MNYSLQGSPFNSNENEIGNDDIERKRQQRNTKNKTLKKQTDRPINNGRLNVNNGLPINAPTERHISSNAKNMIGSIHSQGGDDNEENPLADFYPPPHGELQNRKGQALTTAKDNADELRPIKNYHVTPINEGEEVDGPVYIEGFNNLPTGQTGASYTGPAGYNAPNTHGLTYTGANNYVGPYKHQVPNYTDMSGNKDQLLEKLNYMIYLLEEQQDEKTGHVMEELILYSFLGVFLIFIVDSFARTGKYTR